MCLLAMGLECLIIDSMFHRSEDLRRVGSFLKVETYEFNDYLTRINAGLGADIDMAAMGWTLHNALVLASLVLHSASFPSKNGFNSGYYSSAQVDFLIDKGKNATTLEDAQSNLEELHYTVRRDYPWLFLLNDHPVYVVNRGVHQVHLASPFTLDFKTGISLKNAYIITHVFYRFPDEEV